jgi:hypothetical protein
MYCCSPRHASLRRKTNDWRLSWAWSYGSWIYNYLCSECISPLMLWVRISIMTRCTTSCDKVCQWLETDRWFSSGRPVSTTNKTDLHDIIEKLLKLALSTIKQINKNKDWHTRNQNNVSECRDMSSRGLSFQWAITMNIQLSVLVYKADIIIISSNIAWYCHAIAEPLGHLVINTNHSVAHSLLKYFNKSVKPSLSSSSSLFVNKQ